MRERDQAAKKKMLVRCGARVPGGNQGGTTATNHKIGLRGAVTEREDDAVRTGSDPAPHALCPPAVGDSHAGRGLYQSRVRVGARIRVRCTMAVGVGPQDWRMHCRTAAYIGHSLGFGVGEKCSQRCNFAVWMDGCRRLPRISPARLCGHEWGYNSQLTQRVVLRKWN
jgi:hypothetical protein